MDFEGINHINESVLSKYKKIDINNSSINKYKSSCKGLSHVRTGSDYKGVIYLDEENVVGFYNIRLSDNYLQGIEINKEYQSNGLGKALLNESIKNGVINLSVNKNNDKAINMYKKDFKIIDEDSNMYYMRLKSYKEDTITNEGYLLSKDNLYINFDKFESGESNICLITGLSGSGKSTLGKQLASKYNAEYVELDTFFGIGRIRPEKIEGTIFEEYGKNNKKDYNYLIEKKPRSYEIPDEIVMNFMDWIIPYCKNNKNKKYILEGVQVYSHGDPKMIKNEPVVFINASVLKSMLQRHKRNKARNVSWIDELKELPDMLKYYISDEKAYKRFMKSILNNDVKYETLQYKEKQYSTFDTINDLPYFLPNKLEEFSNYYTNLKEDTEWQESYNDLSVNLIDRNEFININKERINKLNELYYKYPNFDNETKQRILNLGWNPEVPFSVRNRKLATESTRRKLNNYTPIKIEEFVETEEDNIINEAVENKKVPVYMICTWTETAFGKAIRFHTKAIYTHACLAFDSKLDRMFSFNPANGINKLGGLSIEDINKYNQDGSMVVYVTYLSQQQMHKLKSNIDDLMNNVKGTTYSFLNILAMLVNKPIELSHSMVCSQFVDRMLKSVNLDLTNKPSSLVNPKDLYDSKSTKIFKAYEGPIAEFNPKKLKKNADIILRKNKKSINESVYEIPKCLLKNGINYSKLNL